MRHLIRNILPYFLIFCVVIALFFTNYTPGTWLSGWDNLHPEFDFKTNIIERSIFSVWQEYQGLGVRAGNAHAADLLRQIGLFVLSFIFAPQQLRYFYHFFALFIGGIGTYELIKRIVLRPVIPDLIGDPESSTLDSRFRGNDNLRSYNKNGIVQQTGATLGALFYILNLGTMQYFAVPYEAFSHFFASLPWLLLTVFAYVDKQNRKTLALFTLATLLAIPMNYIPTIFVVYCVILGIVCVIFLLTKHCHSERSEESSEAGYRLVPGEASRRPIGTRSFTRYYVGFRMTQIKNHLLTVISIFFITFCINAFWLLPFAAFVKNGTAFVAETKINRMFTEEAFLRNQQFGTLPDVAMLKGFLFNTTDLIDANDTHDFLIKPWITYLKEPAIQFIYYVLFFCICIGYGRALLKKTPNSLTFLLLFLLSLFALFTTNPPTGILFEFLQTHLPLFKQIFRFPFTKILPVAVLSYAVGFAYCVSFMTQKLKKGWAYSILGICIGAILITQIPSFTGNFLYTPMKVRIPEEYFDVFDFFKTQDPNGKIANLPQATFWGWTTYDWGYRGSGFPWYGIKQPILDRAFDVWNTTNEAYYRDLTLALYASNTPQTLEDVFTRYEITYIWLDERVIFPSNPSILMLEETKKRLTDLPSVKKVFTSGKQTLYQYKDAQSPIRFATEKELLSYPFAYLKNGKQIPSIQMTDQGTTISASVAPGTLVIPSFFGKNSPTLARVINQGDTLSFQPIIPSVELNTTPLPMGMDTFTIAQKINGAPLLEINNNLIHESEQDAVVPLFAKNSIRLYKDSPRETHDITPRLSTQPIHNCSAYAATSDLIFGKEEQPNTLILFGKMGKPCIYAPLSELIQQTEVVPQPTLIKIHISFADTDTAPTLCISKVGDSSCLPQKTVNTQTNDDEIEEDIYVPIQNALLPELWLKVELDADGKQTLSRLEIQNLQFQMLSPMYEKSFDIPETPMNSIDINQPSTLKITIPTITTKSVDFSDTKQARNCYALGSGSFTKIITTDPAIGTYTRYSARDASSCDWKEIQTPFISAGAILSLQTRNISGRPIKVCVKNETPGFCLLEDIVQVSKNTWETPSFIIPEVNTSGTYNTLLELDNLAVGNEKRINDVGRVTVTSIPYSWLTSIISTPSDIQGQVLNVLPTAIDHPNPAYYKIELRVPSYEYRENTNDQSSNSQLAYSTTRSLTTLILSQSFDKGWKGYVLPKIESRGQKTEIIQQKLFEWFPFVFGKELKEHVLVNNWENGWNLPNTEDGRQKIENADPSSVLGPPSSVVVLFFLPQLLQYLGFALLLCPLVVLSMRRT